MSVHLITGAVASGKTRRAITLARQFKGSRVYLATGQALDDEMKARIDLHREERGQDFNTIEEPLHLTKALQEALTSSVCVVDCLTLWISNCLHHGGASFLEEERKNLLAFLMEHVTGGPHFFFISDEVGWGGIAMDPLMRQFQRHLGDLGQHIAAISDSVELVTCGYPLILKGKPL